MKKLILLLMFCLCANAYGTLGEMHDAHAEGAKNSPVNGQWSYRAGENTPNVAYGGLLTWYAADQWGFGEHYGSNDPAAGHRPLFDVDALGLHPNFYAVEGVNDPLDEQVGGHANYMLRWTANADTADGIQISGYIYNANSPRPTNWIVLKNDVEIASGLTAHTATENLWGYDNRLTFSESLVSGSLAIDVADGDTIDIITPPSELIEPGPPVTVFMKYTITEVPTYTLTMDYRVDSGLGDPSGKVTPAPGVYPDMAEGMVVNLSADKLGDPNTLTAIDFDHWEISPVPAVPNGIADTGSAATTVTIGGDYTITAVYEEAGFTWDARVGFLGDVDQSLPGNPLLPWSYRAGEETPMVPYGELLSWYAADQWGFGPHYGSNDPGANERPLVIGSLDNVHPNFPNDGAVDPLNEQMGGHGAYMIRWTSPIAGWIEIDGYIYQMSSANLTNWQILKNDVQVANGYTPFTGTIEAGIPVSAGDPNDDSSIDGYDNRVSFADALESGSLQIEVNVGDDIDIITPGTPGWGNGGPVAVFVQYQITDITGCGDPSHLPVPEDINKDCRVDWLDVADMSAKWLFCNAPECD